MTTANIAGGMRGALVSTALSLLWVLGAAASSEACSVCYGDPGSPQANAMRMGIFVLLGFIGSVLAGFGGLFLYWMSRSRRLALIEEGAPH